MVLDGNLEGAQYILGFKVLRDYKNRKILLCQAYIQVSFQNEGLYACVPIVEIVSRSDVIVDKIPYVENL